MRLTDILTPERIRVPLTSRSKQGVIEELVDLLVSQRAITDRERVLQAILEREKTRTTGIGRGLAIPHGKSEGVKGLAVAIGTSGQGVDFDSVDHLPVKLVVLLVSRPEQVGLHIQALARISRLFSVDALREKLAAFTCPEAAFEAIQGQRSAG